MLLSPLWIIAMFHLQRTIYSNGSSLIIGMGPKVKKRNAVTSEKSYGKKESKNSLGWLARDG